MKSCAVLWTEEVQRNDGRTIIVAQCSCNETASCSDETTAARWHELHLKHPGMSPEELALNFDEHVEKED